MSACSRTRLRWPARVGRLSLERLARGSLSSWLSLSLSSWLWAGLHHLLELCW